MLRFGMAALSPAAIYSVDNHCDDYREALRLIALHDLEVAGVPPTHQSVKARSDEWHNRFMRENQRNIRLALAAAQDQLQDIYHPQDRRLVYSS